MFPLQRQAASKMAFSLLPFHPVQQNTLKELKTVRDFF